MIDEFALNEEEIKEEFRHLLKLGQRTDTSTSLSLRGMLQYIISKQELFPDNRQRNALAAFLKGENNVIDLQDLICLYIISIIILSLPNWKIQLLICNLYLNL